MTREEEIQNLKNSIISAKKEYNDFLNRGIMTENLRHDLNDRILVLEMELEEILYYEEEKRNETV